jgi:copper chaperone NosL
MNRIQKTFLTIITLLLLVLTACSPKPEPLNFGQDGCAYCKMKMMDDRYGAEIVTTKGKVYKFDSIECLAADLVKGTVPKGVIHSLYVIDFETPGQLIPTDSAHFVISKKLLSPMGMNISAYRDTAIAANVARLYFGEQVSWQAVQDSVRKKWF